MAAFDAVDGKQHGNSKRVVGRPFKKGQSGNPNGRPPGPSPRTVIKQRFQEAMTDEARAKWADSLIAKALENATFAQIVIESIDGKLVEHVVQHTGWDIQEPDGVADEPERSAELIAELEGVPANRMRGRE